MTTGAAWVIIALCLVGSIVLFWGIGKLWAKIKARNRGNVRG